MKTNPTKTVNELISALAYITDLEKDKKNYHSWRTAIVSAEIAKHLVGAPQLKDIFYAALLHDVGAVGLPYHIIHYLGKTDKASRSILLSHPVIGAQLVSSIPQMTQPAKFILDHHEWINGSGYPRAKIGNDVPQGAQILRISDTIDIIFQTKKISGILELENALSKTVNKEFSEKLYSIAISALKNTNFFKKISRCVNMESLFKKTQKTVGAIQIPSQIDAIGTTLETLAQIIDMKHPYTWGHSLRVCRYAVAGALAMNLNHDKITDIKWAGLIHDIGKLSIDRKILNKPSRLSPKQFEEIKKHVTLTKEILGMISGFNRISLAAAAHHERFDGTGYPRRLKGNEIPLGGRILSICDAFDAMTSHRPYRKSLSIPAACEEIEKNAGTQFDPKITKQLLPLFKNLVL